MRSCDSRCLFSGSKGEVCSIEPLCAPPDFRDHPISNYSLLAMASLTKVHKQAHLGSRCKPLSSAYSLIFVSVLNFFVLWDSFTRFLSLDLNLP